MFLRNVYVLLWSTRKSTRCCNTEDKHRNFELFTKEAESSCDYFGSGPTSSVICNANLLAEPIHLLYRTTVFLSQRTSLNLIVLSCREGFPAEF
jgi:hypothetical protein